MRWASKDLSLFLDCFYYGHIGDSAARRAYLDALLREDRDSQLLRLIAKTKNQISLDDTVRLLAQVSLHDLAIDIFAIRIITGLEVLFH